MTLTLTKKTPTHPGVPICARVMGSVLSPAHLAPSSPSHTSLLTDKVRYLTRTGSGGQVLSSIKVYFSIDGAADSPRVHKQSQPCLD